MKEFKREFHDEGGEKIGIEFNFDFMIYDSVEIKQGDQKIFVPGRIMIDFINAYLAGRKLKSITFHLGGYEKGGA